MHRRSEDPGADPAMSIGTFSRASLLTVKALRNYHERGLLVPASVDPDTGYRSYRASQLPDAAIVRRLRDLDVSLEDIGTIVDARDPEVTRKVIGEHESRMRERLADLEQVVDELQRSAGLPSMHTPIHVRVEPPVTALVVRGTVHDGDYAPFLDDAYGRIFAEAGRSGATIASAGSARYPSVAGDVEEIEAYVAIEAPVVLSDTVAASGVLVDVIPEATCAVATHVGGYDRIGETYAHLGAWVAGNARPLDVPVREHYVVSIDPTTLQLLPPDERRTEIAWPISPTDPHQETPT
ncbi:MAG: MerR family transcriptional regulator [Actinomycetota bacterium]